MNSRKLFEHGGEMGTRMRELDWSATPVGAVESWPESLASVVAVCLRSRFPIVIWWGREHYTTFYNDPYISFLGKTKHPDWLGRSGRDCWKEIWPTIGPMLESVFDTGTPTWSEDLLLILDRNLPREEAYFTFSYSAIPSASGGVDGIFCACFETTERVIGERQLALMRNLAASAADARTFDEACSVSAVSLAQDSWDLPFAMIYLVDADARTVRLAGAAGIDRGHPFAPETVSLADQSSPWPFAAVMTEQKSRLVDLGALTAPFPMGVWDDAPRQAVATLIAPSGATGKAGVLIVGLNPMRPFDANGQRFVDLTAAQIAAGLGNAQAYEEERQRAEALAEIDRAKTTFFSNVSHEFRTPLTLMLGPLEDMLTGKTEPGPEPLHLVHRNCVRLMKLVNTLLDFSRIEAGRIQASYEPIDLAATTRDSASMFRAAIERAGLALFVDCPAASEHVYVDRDMWEKIVLNLLSNALKFTFAGEIRVTLREAPDHLQLAVQDTGIGIAANEVPRVFERFHRIEGARSRTYEGSGIGLALVQELVKLHAGRIGVDSRPGTGTTFIVTIPKGTDHLPADRIGAPKTLAPTSVGHAYVLEAEQWISQAAGENVVVPGSLDVDPQIHILLVDDNADMREYVARLLRARWIVEAVGDGEAALAAIRRRRPTLLLTDVMMPGLDGFGLLRAIRGDPSTRSIPVIMLSARAGKESRVEGLEAGADDYLVKPFSSRELIARVAARLEQRHPLDREPVLAPESTMRIAKSIGDDAGNRPR